MVDIISEELKRRNIKFTSNAELEGLSTFGIKGRAALLALPKSPAELIQIIEACLDNEMPYRVIGRMSNTMPGSEYFHGVLIRTTELSRCHITERGIYAECGCALPMLVRLGMEHSLGGIEALYHIPGTLGGAVYGNAGACGMETGDAFISGSFYNPKRRAICTLDKEQLCFSYRKSALRENGLIFLGGETRLAPRSKEEIMSLILAHKEKRNNQPKGVKTLGSTFKRVGDVSAGYYIDKAGLKGYSVGGAEVSRVHAGFIINRGGATFEDVFLLIEHIKTRVFECFGIVLEEEIQIL